MTKAILASLVVLLASCAPEPEKDAGGSGPPAPAPVMSLVNTSWEFTAGGKRMALTVDPSGAYVEERDGTHVDHGTYAQVGGKDCFTSAMGDQGVNCWTAIPETPIGGTASATSDKGQKSVFTRVAYRSLNAPS